MQNQGKTASIKINFIMNAILSVSSFIFPLITFPYVSRILLAEGIGKVNFANSLVTYFVTFSSIGIPLYGVRACAQVRDNKEELTKVTHELLILNLIMVLLSYAVFIPCTVFIPKMREAKTLMLITSTSIFFNAIGIEWMYKGLEKYTFLTVRSLIFRVLSIIAIFALVHSKEDYIIYGAVSIFFGNVLFFLNFLHAGNYISLKPVGGYNYSRHLKPVAVFFAMSCATTIYNYLDSVMLGFMTTDADVGYFNVAVKSKLILTSVVISLGTVLLPRSSYYIQQREFDRFYEICKKALNFVFVLSIPLTVFFVIFSDRAIKLLSGPTFGPAVPAMQIIMPTVFLIGVNNILAIQMLVPLGREKTVFLAELSGAAADLIINLLLIPRFKSAGAAFGTLMAELTVTLICYWSLREETKDAFRSLSYWKIAAALVGASGTLLWMRIVQTGNFLTLFISAILFFGVYGGILYILKEALTCELIDQTFSKIRDILHSFS